MSHRKDVTDDRIRELASGGYSYAKIAMLLNCSQRMVNKRALAMGLVSPCTARRLSREDADRILEMHGRGMLGTEIAEVLPWSHPTIMRVIRAARKGVPAPAKEIMPDLPWPEVTTTAEAAFGGRRFDEHRVPAGERLVGSRFSRVIAHSPMGCAAAMCEGA